MPLSPSDTRAVFARECRFPAERSDVAEAVGDVAIDAPMGEPVHVRTILELSDVTVYDSADELHNTVMANLDADHVGRRYYDDRSPNHARDDTLSF